MYKRESYLRRKRRLRHARIRTLVILLLIAGCSVAFFQNAGGSNNEERPANSYAVSAEETAYDAVANSVNAGKTGINDVDIKDMGKEAEVDSEKQLEDIKSESIDDWRILLINADNPVPDDYTFELSALDVAREFDSRAIDDLKMLIDECRRQTGASIWAQSTYRDRDTQKKLYENKVKEYINSGKSKEEAEKLASTSVSRPGTSEHEVGLAVDFNYANVEFQNAKAFEWLTENAHEYGFILRYPDGKQSITKIIYEPWHFRYVGKEHAEVIKSKGFCLEEYIEYLKDQ